MRRMTPIKEAAQRIYWGNEVPPKNGFMDLKGKVDLLVSETGCSRSYAYDLYRRLEMGYLLRCFDRS